MVDWIKIPVLILRQVLIFAPFALSVSLTMLLYGNGTFTPGISEDTESAIEIWAIGIALSYLTRWLIHEHDVK